MSQELKNIVHQHRRSSGLSQSELAKVAGVGKTVIFDIEHGKESVQFDTLKKVLGALNIRFVFQSPLIERQNKTASPPAPHP
ncbi:MAG: helix-turn-helix domain-containing protein [Limisphaerales bacterium]